MPNYWQNSSNKLNACFLVPVMAISKILKIIIIFISNICYFPWDFVYNCPKLRLLLILSVFFSHFIGENILTFSMTREFCMKADIHITRNLSLNWMNWIITCWGSDLNKYHSSLPKILQKNSWNAGYCNFEDLANMFDFSVKIYDW